MSKINEQNYVEEAERAIIKLKSKKDEKGRPIKVVTTSKLRNLLAMSADIYNEVINNSEEIMDKEVCSRIEYLRVRFIYEAGREPQVKNLINADGAGLLDLLKEVGNSRKKYILFYRYMEALVAFRKYHVGGNDEND